LCLTPPTTKIYIKINDDTTNDNNRGTQSPVPGYFEQKTIFKQRYPTDSPYDEMQVQDASATSQRRDRNQATISVGPFIRKTDSNKDRQINPGFW
jgi:hypothetical protein